MSDSFILYRSFHEALKEVPESYGKLMLAINEYALDGTMPDMETFSGYEKAIFFLMKPQIDANTRKQENGKLGGRPNQKPMVSEKDKTEKPMVIENEPNQKPMVSEKAETEKPNVNDNDNVNENDNSLSSEPNKNDLGTEREDNGSFQKTIFKMLVDHNSDPSRHKIKIPLDSDGKPNFMNFLTTQCRELVDRRQGYSLEQIEQALKNYLEVASIPPDKCKKTVFAWKNFLNELTDFIPGNFTIGDYLQQNKALSFDKKANALQQAESYIAAMESES